MWWTILPPFCSVQHVVLISLLADVIAFAQAVDAKPAQCRTSFAMADVTRSALVDRDRLGLTRARARDPRPAHHAAEDPGVRQHHPDQPRTGRGNDPLGSRSAAGAPRPLHRRRFPCRLRAVGPRRAAARHAHGLRSQRLPARGRAVQVLRQLGGDFEDERRGAALPRSHLPQPARARAVVFPRILQPAAAAGRCAAIPSRSICGVSIRGSGSRARIRARRPTPGWRLCRHYPLISPRQEKLLSRRDPFERRAARLLEYPPPRA